MSITRLGDPFGMPIIDGIKSFRALGVHIAACCLDSLQPDKNEVILDRLPLFILLSPTQCEHVSRWASEDASCQL